MREFLLCVDERIHIDDAIQIVIVGSSRGSVRIGIKAPGHIPINREEVLLGKAKVQRRTIKEN